MFNFNFDGLLARLGIGEGQGRTEPRRTEGQRQGREGGSGGGGGERRVRRERVDDYQTRLDNLHPSTTPQEVRAENGLNQRALGMPSACTYFAVAFVRRFLDGTVSSHMLTPEFISNVLLDPGIEIPKSLAHPDPVAVVNDPRYGMCVLSGDCRTRSRDSVDVSLDLLETKLTLWLTSRSTVIGLLIITGTETFGVARTSDNFVTLFDSHGDSTQTQPAVVFTWNTNLLDDKRPPSIADGAKGVVDFIRSRSGEALNLMGNFLDVCIVGNPAAIPIPST